MLLSLLPTYQLLDRSDGFLFGIRQYNGTTSSVGTKGYLYSIYGEVQKLLFYSIISMCNHSEMLDQYQPGGMKISFSSDAPKALPTKVLQCCYSCASKMENVWNAFIVSTDNQSDSFCCHLEENKKKATESETIHHPFRTQQKRAFMHAENRTANTFYRMFSSPVFSFFRT